MNDIHEHSETQLTASRNNSPGGTFKGASP